GKVNHGEQPGRGRPGRFVVQHEQGALRGNGDGGDEAHGGDGADTLGQQGSQSGGHTRPHQQVGQQGAAGGDGQGRTGAGVPVGAQRHGQHGQRGDSQRAGQGVFEERGEQRFHGSDADGGTTTTAHGPRRP